MAYFGQSLPFVQMLAASPFLMILLMVGGVIAAVAMRSIVNESKSPLMGMLLLGGISAMSGVFLSGIFVVYPMENILMAFFGASALFLGAALYGYTTKRAIENAWGYAMWALYGLFAVCIIHLVAVVGFGVNFSWLDLGISLAAVPLFTVLTALDVRMLQLLHKEQSGVVGYGDSVLGALNLYLDFLNLFVHLLSLLGFSKD